MTDFNQQAKDFVQKAKEAGASNLQIANVLNYKFQTWQKEQEQADDWELVDVDGDGIKEWVNTKTKQIEKTSDSSANDILSNLENDMPGSDFSSVEDASTFDFSAFENEFGADAPTQMGDTDPLTLIENIDKEKNKKKSFMGSDLAAMIPFIGPVLNAFSNIQEAKKQSQPSLDAPSISIPENLSLNGGQPTVGADGQPTFDQNANTLYLYGQPIKF